MRKSVAPQKISEGEVKAPKSADEVEGRKGGCGLSCNVLKGCGLLSIK